MRRKLRTQVMISIFIMGFLVGSYRGRLAIWKGDDPQPYRVYPCPVYLLPKQERNALQRGIRINTMDDLEQFLENFLS